MKEELTTRPEDREFSGLARELYEVESGKKEILKDKESTIILPPELGGKKVNVHEFGNPDGKIIIALHGWGANGIAQQNIYEKLAKYHVISFDLPGFGKSEPLNSEDCHIERYVDAIDWLSKEVANGEEVHAFMGHSLGGVLATKLLVERHQIHKDIQEEMAPNSSSMPKPLAKKLILTSVPVNGVPDGEVLSNPLMARLAKELFEGMPKLPRRLKYLKDKLDSKGVINPESIDDRYIRRDRGTHGWTAVDLADQLVRVNLTNLDYGDVDVCYLNGRDDKYTSPAEIMNQALKAGADVHVYQDAGHDAHYDACDKMSADINEFLERK